MYWEGNGKISKLKNNFLQELLLLQPIMILIIFLCNLIIFILSEECPHNNKPFVLYIFHTVVPSGYYLLTVRQNTTN